MTDKCGFFTICNCARWINVVEVWYLKYLALISFIQLLQGCQINPTIGHRYGNVDCYEKGDKKRTNFNLDR